MGGKGWQGQGLRQRLEADRVMIEAARFKIAVLRSSRQARRCAPRPLPTLMLLYAAEQDKARCIHSASLRMPREHLSRAQRLRRLRPINLLSHRRTTAFSIRELKSQP